ncbi:hypothetical protein EGK_06408, partial [Macaca mulatta]
KGLSRLQAVYSDLDNTPIDTTWASQRSVLKMIKLLQEEANTNYDKVQVKLSKTCISDLRTSHWEKAIPETKGGAASRKSAEECYFLWKSKRTLAEDVKAVFTELQKEVRLLLLTNGDRRTQREKTETCGCESYFDTVVGGKQREKKPVPSMFYYCSNPLRVQPGD